MRNVAVQLNSLGETLRDYELLVEISEGEKGKICTKPEVNKPGLQCEMHIRLLLE